MKQAANRTERFSARTVAERCEGELALLAWTLRQNTAASEATNSGEIQRSRENAIEVLIDAAAWLNRFPFERDREQPGGPTFKLLRGQFFRAMRRILDPRTSREQLARDLESAAEIVGAIGRSIVTRSVAHRERTDDSVLSLRVPARRH